MKEWRNWDGDFLSINGLLVRFSGQNYLVKIKKKKYIYIIIRREKKILKC